jgi:hypothetical protein
MRALAHEVRFSRPMRQGHVFSRLSSPINRTNPILIRATTRSYLEPIPQITPIKNIPPLRIPDPITFHCDRWVMRAPHPQAVPSSKDYT